MRDPLSYAEISDAKLRTPWHPHPVTATEAIELLEKFRAGKINRDRVLRAFQAAPVVDLGFAGKIFEREQRILVTRINGEHARALRKKFKPAVHHETARCVTIEKSPAPKRPGTIAVLCAGTSDLPAAEEAAVTADIMGNRVERIYDVGVAGLHRLLRRLELIQSANVIVVVAGMEGALPSVVAGLVSRPVIAVPTSIGYGASFGGLAALLGMLNSCGTGVTVVNIDNGFGAGYAAGQINALASGSA